MDICGWSANNHIYRNQNWRVAVNLDRYGHVLCYQVGELWEPLSMTDSCVVSKSDDLFIEKMVDSRKRRLSVSLCHQII